MNARNNALAALHRLEDLRADAAADARVMMASGRTDAAYHEQLGQIAADMADWNARILDIRGRIETGHYG